MERVRRQWPPPLTIYTFFVTTVIHIRYANTVILCEPTRTWTLDDYVKNGIYYFLCRLIQMFVLLRLTMKYLIRLLWSVAPLF